MDYQLVVLRGRSASQTVRLTSAVTTVGRQEGCQLRISSSQVSRKHCQLFEKKGLLLVKDLGSSNGTFVNGVKITDQRVLEPGDELAVGQIKFRVERQVEATPKPGDTAISQAMNADEPMTVNADEVFDEVFEVDEPLEADTPAPRSTAPAAKAPSHQAPTLHAPTSKSPASPSPKAPAADKPAPAPQELGEEAVADFLLNLDVDEE